MRNRFILVAAVSLLFLGGETQAQKQGNALKGLVVVAEAGHGSLDTAQAYGCIWQGLKLYTVMENRLAMKVALQLKALVESNGGKFISTTTFLDTTNVLIPGCRGRSLFDMNAKFPDGSWVSYPAGMPKRAAVVNRAVKQYGQKRVVYISFHFDRGNPFDYGLYVIGPRFGGRPQIAAALLKVFGQKDFLRSHDQYVRNGSKEIDRRRRLFVLRSDRVLARQRVIAELDNMGNFSRLFWLVEPENQAFLAETTYEALVVYNAERQGKPVRLRSHLPKIAVRK